MSLHQTGFQEVLSAADLLGRYPARLALIGCQPLDLEDWGGPLTAPARAAIDPALSDDIDYHAYERRAPSGVADELGD